MRTHNMDEIRSYTIEELKEKIIELKEELLKLRFQHSIGQLENPMKIRITKRNIARLKTVLNEKLAEQKK